MRRGKGKKENALMKHKQLQSATKHGKNYDEQIRGKLMLRLLEVIFLIRTGILGVCSL